MNLLRNGGFEEDWGMEMSHECLIVPGLETRQVGNIFTPPGWVTWFRHEAGTWDQPEVMDAWRTHDSRRVKEGLKAIMLFTFYRTHDAGFYQQITIEPETTLRLTAFGHAWSNHKGVGFPHPDEGRWSEGAGYEVVAWTQDEIPLLNGESQNDAKGNVMLAVGIDPTGGIDPDSSEIEWSDPLYCYNGYSLPLTIDAVAQSSTVTIFLRSITLWPFKHNNVYWDDISLEEIAPLPERGLPRIQYDRTYVLLTPDMGAPWVRAVIEATWDSERFTIGSSADDAGIGNLDYRRILAVNPGGWPSDLSAFFEEHYPGIEYIPVHAASPADLGGALNEALGKPPPLPPLPDEPPPTLPPSWSGMEPISLHVQQSATSDGYGDLDFVRDVQPAVVKTVMNMELLRAYKAVSPDTITVYRQFTDHQEKYWSRPDLRQGAREFLYTFLDSLQANRDFVDAVEGLNEIGIAYGDRDGIERQVEFECYFAEALREEGSPAVPSLLAVAVGNPGGFREDIELLIPAVRVVIRDGGFLNYHGYFRASRGEIEPGWDENWAIYAGRCLVSWDSVFTSYNLYPRYILGESGAFFTSAAGWKHLAVLAGDWNAYAMALLEMRRRIIEWNLGHGNRCAGMTIFTYCGPGEDWQWYNVYGYLRKLADLLIQARGD